MSDPVTNVEIEDVLSSIRRLMIDGDITPAQDPVTNLTDAAPVHDTLKIMAELGEPKLDTFVLTPAFMVVGKVGAVVAVTEVENDVLDENAGWVEEISAKQKTNGLDKTGPVAGALEETAQSINIQVLTADSINIDATELKVASQVVDVLLTEIARTSVNEEREAGLATILPQAEIAKVKAEADSFANDGQTFDRTKLIATIVELEAAVTNDVHDFKSDCSEVEDEALDKTVALSESFMRSYEDVQDAKNSILTKPESEAIKDNPASSENQSTILNLTTKPKLSLNKQLKYATINSNDDDCYCDDDLDGLFDIGDVSLDEDALSSIISKAVRKELEGPLGERITQNLRKLIRREIYRILSSKEFD